MHENFSYHDVSKWTRNYKVFGKGATGRKVNLKSFGTVWEYKVQKFIVPPKG